MSTYQEPIFPMQGIGKLNQVPSRTISKCNAELPTVLFEYPSMEKNISPGSTTGFGSIFMPVMCNGLDGFAGTFKTIYCSK